MYALFHPDFVAHSWHTFIAFILSAWMCALVVIYMHHWLPFLNKLGVFIVVGGVLATIVTCSIMPSQTGSGYASSKFVWASWSNGTGYSSNGFVFLLGMLNGAFAIATPGKWLQTHTPCYPALHSADHVHRLCASPCRRDTPVSTHDLTQLMFIRSNILTQTAAQCSSSYGCSNANFNHYVCDRFEFYHSMWCLRLINTTVHSVFWSQSFIQSRIWTK